MKRRLRVLTAVLLLLLFTLSVGFSAPHRHLSVIEEFTAAVDDVKRDFPLIKNAKVVVNDLPEIYYAVTTGTIGDRDFRGVVVLNRFYADDRAKLEGSIDYDVKLGFHPSLGRCTEIQYIAYHEAAHLVDDSFGLDAHGPLVDVFGDAHALRGVLPGYAFYPAVSPWPGLLNAPEALAEAYASVRCNGGNWAEKELSHMLETRGKI